MRKRYVWVILLWLSVISVRADDLYKVVIRNSDDAATLKATGAQSVFRIVNGYLVLADSRAASSIRSSSLLYTLVAPGVEKSQLAVDRTRPEENQKKYRPIYDENGLRLYTLPTDKGIVGATTDGLMPLPDIQPPIEYRPATVFNDHLTLGDINLDSLIALISQDSLTSDMNRLEAFHGRLTGTDSCRAARDWIAAKFRSFGYDSIIIDSFTGKQLWDYHEVPSLNVVAVKKGTRFPDCQIIIGGHYDVVPDCPGADDNGSGTAGTIEIARVLAHVPTEMTIVFIAFDSEESWLYGSTHYANAAKARNDNIVVMLNMDMIANLPNSDKAKLYYGSTSASAQLWSRLADSLVAITGVLSGSTASDQLPFIQNGYDGIFIQEYTFSSVYHCNPTPDDMTKINMEYMTRMVKATLATAAVIDRAMPPIILASVRDVGDGHSLEIGWVPGDPDQIDHYWLHYSSDSLHTNDSVLVPRDSTRFVFGGLTTGVRYAIHLIAYDASGTSSYGYHIAYGTPYLVPRPPQSVTAHPVVHGVMLSWMRNNDELDFHHYALIRDNQLLPPQITDTTYIDTDPTLGSGLHSYLVVAVDKDNNQSDTSGIPPAISKTASLQPGRILAVNRSAVNMSAIVNESVTGDFLRDALSGLAYDYYSDTAYGFERSVGMLDFVDYELVVVGGESGRGQDDIGGYPENGGILEQLIDYQSLGGKVILFGRWGADFITGTPRVDYHSYTPDEYAYRYIQSFHVAGRSYPRTVLDPQALTLNSDFVGAFPYKPEYPELSWDSMATMDHTGSPFKGVTGIPCPSIATHASADDEILYLYLSATQWDMTHGRTIAWRHRGDHEFVFFNFPLSFMQRPAAKAALRQAVADMGLTVAVDDNHSDGQLPRDFELAQNYPNPFNPTTTIEFYNPKNKAIPVTVDLFNIMGQKVRTLLGGPALPGKNRILWDGRDGLGQPVATGIYFYRLKTADVTLTKKMLLIK
jgi:hypothetical protein